MLRGVAILLVLAIHIPHGAPGGWRENPWLLPSFLADFGYMGVPLFIVISGFCIHRNAAVARAGGDAYRFDWLAFWKRRFIRLYPPYVAAIAFSLAAAFWWHHRFAQPKGFLGWDLGTHLLLVHNLTYEFPTSLGNGAFWSLGTEEQLYALYFVLIAMMSRFASYTWLALVAAITIAWRVLTPFIPEQGFDLGPFHLGQWFQWPLHYWLHWTLGAFAVDAWMGNRTLPAWSCSLALAFALLAAGMLVNSNTFEFLAKTSLHPQWMRDADPALLAAASNVGELVALLGFFCLLNWSLRAPDAPALLQSPADALAWVGRISYSLYLVHIPVIYILEERVYFAYSVSAWPWRYFAYAGVAIAVAWLFHHAVERWFLKGRLPSFSVRPELPEKA
jgi:peptidoglycan/LPS O-acetylase OafA/YrhL